MATKVCPALLESEEFCSLCQSDRIFCSYVTSLQKKVTAFSLGAPGHSSNKPQQQLKKHKNLDSSTCKDCLLLTSCDSKGCLEFCLKWSLSVAPFGLCRCVIRADCHGANTSGHHHPVDGPKNESSQVFLQLPSTASLLWCTVFSAVRVVDMLEESPSTLGVQPPLLEMQRPSWLHPDSPARPAR